jgi:hypothetical protein
MTLVVMVVVSSLSHADSASKNPGKSRKRGVETSYYSRQMNQAKYSKCPRFSTQKRAFK